MVSTHLKNVSQIGSFPQVGVKIKKYLKPPPRQKHPSAHPKLRKRVAGPTAIGDLRVGACGRKYPTQLWTFS